MKNKDLEALGLTKEQIKAVQTIHSEDMNVVRERRPPAEYPRPLREAIINLPTKGGQIMSYYTICPYCGAALDPGERCDCGPIEPGGEWDPFAKKKAAPDAGTSKAAKGENGLIEPVFASIIPEKRRKCK